MTARSITWGAALAALLVAGSRVNIAMQPAETSPRSTPARRSVVFWLVDTLRADRLGIYGHHGATSPFLDALAAEGVVFERCYAQAPWTKPSMAALLTARYPAALGTFGMFDRLDDSALTMPEVLARAGYDTAGFSANPIMGRFSNYQQGFRTFVELPPTANRGEFDGDRSSAAALLPSIEDWIARPRTAPFFLYVHSVDPHEQYQPSREYLARFADPAGEPRYREEWAALRRAHPDQLTNRSTQIDFDVAGVEPNAFVDYGSRLYDGETLATDAALRRLWERLRELSLDDEILFVFASDHGEEFFEHGGTSHGFSLHDEILRVPCVLWGPGVVPSRRVASPVRSFDLLPTLLDLLEISVPPKLDGESLAPWIRSGTAPPEGRKVFAEKRDVGPTIFGNFPTGSAVALIDWPWKYILNIQPPARLTVPERQLFNLARDAGEQVNLVGQEPAIAARLDDELRRWHGSFTPPIRTAPSASALDAAARERLRQLGYAP